MNLNLAPHPLVEVEGAVQWTQAGGGPASTAPGAAAEILN